MNLKRTLATAAFISLFAVGGPAAIASEEQKPCAESAGCAEDQKAASGDLAKYRHVTEEEFRFYALRLLTEIKVIMQRIESKR